MWKKKGIVILFVVMITANLWGQHTPTTQTIATPPAATPATDFNITGTVTMIENRARVFGDRADGSDTRYFSVTDSDLAGKTPAEVLARLSPSAVTAQQHVRTFDIVVDLNHPLLISTSAKSPITIGTVIVEGDVNSLEVVSNLIMSEVRVLKK